VFSQSWQSVLSGGLGAQLQPRLLFPLLRAKPRPCLVMQCMVLPLPVASSSTSSSAYVPSHMSTQQSSPHGLTHQRLPSQGSGGKRTAPGTGHIPLYAQQTESEGSRCLGPGKRGSVGSHTGGDHSAGVLARWLMWALGLSTLGKLSEWMCL
jgi:hypothetical protein